MKKKTGRSSVKEASSSRASQTAELFHQSQQGKDGAFSDLVKRIHQRLYRFCLYLTGNRALAEDLCQEAYLKVLQNIQTLDNPDNFMSWLFKITKNHFLNYVKSPKNKPHAALDEQFDLSGPRPIKYELAAQVAQALMKLDAEDRFLVLLVYLEGRSYTEAADLAGLTEEAVRSRLYRVRKTLDRKDFFTGQIKKG